MFKRLMIATGVLLGLWIGVGAWSNIVESRHPDMSVASSSGFVSSEDMKKEVNAYRVQNGNISLATNGLLDQSAQYRADFLCDTNTWSHEGWTDSLAPYMATGVKAGENLEYGPSTQTARTIVRNWADSPTHNANMLNKDYTEFGMGVRYCKKFQGNRDITIVVNHFGRPSW